MSGRKETTNIIPGDSGLSVGKPNKTEPLYWKWIKLSDVATMATGHTPSRRHPEYWDGDIPWIAVGDCRFLSGKTIYFTKEKTNHLGIKNSAAVLLPENTVCLSRTGSIGYCVIMGTKMATSQGFVNWICSNQLIPRFLQLLFVAERSFLYRISEGTAHTTIYFPEVKAFHVCLPPLCEQRAIVNKIEYLFSELDDGIKNLKKAQTQLKIYRQAVLKKAFEGKLTKEWRENNKTNKSFDYLGEVSKKRKDEFLENKRNGLKKIKNNYDFKFSKYEHIETWSKGFLDKLIYISARIGWRGLKKSEYTESGPLFLSVHSLNYGKYVDFSQAYHISEERYIESHEIQLKEGDVLLCKDGAGIGKIAIIKNLTTKATVNSSLLVIRGLEIFTQDFLYYLFSGPALQKIVFERITGSATPHLFQNDIRKFELLIPPLKEQEQIVIEIESRLSVCDKLEESIKESLLKSEALRQSILKKAFEGKLLNEQEIDACRQEPDWEPAEMLLERIKNESEL